MLLDLGFDVFNVGYDFRGEPGPSQRPLFLMRDIRETFARAVSERKYERLIIGAKSLGTRGLAVATAGGLLQSFSGKIGLIWLTAVWNVEEIFETISAGEFPGLHVMGEADPLFEKDKATALAAVSGQQVLTIPGADHSLDIDGDTEASIAILSKIVGTYRQWLGHFLG
jgi:hypothetical protein